MELTLRLQQNDLETLVPGDRTEFTIGRLPECDWYLPFGEISRQHARLTRTERGEWQIEDTGSKNGTQLNGKRVTSPQILHHGDLLDLGDLRIAVSLNLHPQPAPAPPQATNLYNIRDLQQQWLEGRNPDKQAPQDKDEAISRLQDLVAIGKQLSAATSLEEIFDRVQEAIFRCLARVDRIALLIQDESSGALVLLHAATRNPRDPASPASDNRWVSRTICQTVFKERVAVQTADARADERFSGQHSILVNDIRSCIAVPLWDEDRAIGVLYGDAHHSSADWMADGERDLSFFSALANLIAANVQRWLLLQKFKSEEMLRQRLERYHSPSLVRHLLAASPETSDTVTPFADSRLPPIESEISILFADVVGFTALSERLSPVSVAQLLNRLFAELTEEVFAREGTLDKYIGDCIMAFFGAPQAQPDHADRAVAVALGMLQRLAALNASDTFDEPLQLRIAVNTGRAVVGDVGSPQRLEYTALGATINLASRMEGICPPGECIISETTYQQLSCRETFEEMGDYRFRGIERATKVYRSALAEQTQTLPLC